MKALPANIVDVTCPPCFLLRATTAPLAFIRYTLTSTPVTALTLATDYWFRSVSPSTVKKAPLLLTIATPAEPTTTIKPPPTTTLTPFLNYRATRSNISTPTTTKKPLTQRFLFCHLIYYYLQMCTAKSTVLTL